VTSGARGVLMKAAHGVPWMAFMRNTKRSGRRRLGERGGARVRRETPRRGGVLKKEEEAVSVDGSPKKGFPRVCMPPVRRRAIG
jgi:hypothetical protein